MSDGVRDERLVEAHAHPSEEVSARARDDRPLDRVREAGKLYEIIVGEHPVLTVEGAIRVDHEVVVLVVVDRHRVRHEVACPARTDRIV